MRDCDERLLSLLERDRRCSGGNHTITRARYSEACFILPEKFINAIAEKFDMVASKITDMKFSLHKFMCTAVQVIPGLNIEPYITKYDEKTILVLAHDLFVMINGYEQFVVVRDVVTRRTVKSAYVCLDTVRTMFVNTDSILMRSLYYMNCISACAGIPEFDNIMKTNPTLVDDFVAQAWKEFHCALYDVTFKDLKDEAHKNNVPTVLSDKYYVPYAGNALLSLDISKDRTMVKVETAEGARWLTLPYIDDTRDLCNSAGIRFHWAVKSNTVFAMFLTLACYIQGIVCDMLSIYPCDELLGVISIPEGAAPINSIYDVL